MYSYYFFVCIHLAHLTKRSGVMLGVIITLCPSTFVWFSEFNLLLLQSCLSNGNQAHVGNISLDVLYKVYVVWSAFKSKMSTYKHKKPKVPKLILYLFCTWRIFHQNAHINYCRVSSDLFYLECFRNMRSKVTTFNFPFILFFIFKKKFLSTLFKQILPTVLFAGQFSFLLKLVKEKRPCFAHSL